MKLTAIAFEGEGQSRRSFVPITRLAGRRIFGPGLLFATAFSCGEMKLGRQAGPKGRPL
jgi:hypothetical protein